MLTGSYQTLFDHLSSSIPTERLIHDELRTLAFGTDASFYRLIPKLVVKVENEAEVITVLKETRLLNLPVTFRAAGTSLSGQAISDSVLLVLAPTWTKHRINANASTISLQPGVIGAHANIYLAPHGKKIGPDPASINSAMIGGIAANNASGMCCGTAQNSYRTLESMRIVLADGTTLDSADPASVDRFKATKSDLVERIAGLSARVKSNERLADRIRCKFKMKNTTGYSLNALVDFDDPIDIISHLMIGSEGTLGFISEVTYRTVPELKDKASSLLVFPDIETACTAVPILKQCRVEAVELMDRASLRSVENKSGMPELLKALDDRAAALLVETRAINRNELLKQIEEIVHAVEKLPQVVPTKFTDDAVECTRLWNIRKGLFPSVGAMRATGTTCIIEDVAFPILQLAAATLDLQSLFRTHGYHEAIIFGHALEGNLHFVFNQNFNTQSEVARYARFMEDLADLVIRKYDGSMKAEHGTGRNVAPFVEREWGAEAYALMKEIKAIFDPGALLNPDVIINHDSQAHVKALKPLPAAHEIIDKCIECGFCEVQCPSKNLSITPRQRIVAFREMTRLASSGENPSRLKSLASSFAYNADATCATDGLCATACPVGIDTGKLVKELRFQSNSPFANWVADRIANNMALTVHALRLTLNAANAAHGMLGTNLMERAATFARKLTKGVLPLWNKYLPKGAPAIHPPQRPAAFAEKRVVYFPSCINRAMGVSRDYGGEASVHAATVRLLEKAGYSIIYPENLLNLCCGMAFDSKGFRRQGQNKLNELERALLQASNNGELPVYVDMSPCLYRMKEQLTPRLKLYEPVEFILKYAVGSLEFSKLNEPIAIHTTCSATKMGLTQSLRELASLCSDEVIVPDGVNCCGWAGDRGFSYPELNTSALANLRQSIPENCSHGYSTSRTCEIGLSLHSGISYRSIVHLIDKCTMRKDAH
ncbi:MAG: FAD-binding oxidoreductase [Ignavibacteriae bacterium]|nr:FAD-binding oxidoreductase [Ignavibacteriota bacterium]